MLLYSTCLISAGHLCPGITVNSSVRGTGQRMIEASTCAVTPRYPSAVLDSASTGAAFTVLTTSGGATVVK